MANKYPSSEFLLNTSDKEFSVIAGFSKVEIDQPFLTYKDIMSYQLSDEVFDESGKNKPVLPAALVEALGDNGPIPPERLKKKNRDTRLGGNEAINCYWQFNENDDIMTEYSAIDEANGVGMGRVFSETFDDKQQIMYLTMGVPEFTDLTSFYTNAIDSRTAKLVNNGDFSALDKIFHFIGATAGFIIALPVMPIVYIRKIFSGITRSQAAKYYDFRATMPLYYKTVNTMIAHIAVNLGILELHNDGQGPEVNQDGLPDLVKDTGLDILKILMLKDKRDDGPDVKLKKNTSLDDELEHVLADDKETEHKIDDDDRDGWFGSVLSGFSNGFNYGTLDSLNFIGLRIEKSTDVSESASNSTGEMNIASTINSKATSSIQRKFSTGGNSKTGMLASLAGGLGDIIENALGSLGSSVGVGTAEILKGNGLIDFPEIWTGSSFNRSSYNFTMQLRAPAADKLSIFYYIYIPLAMILCAALPRAVGKNSYTSPFIVRAYTKGMFAVPMGIIDNITIKRGAAEFGWNVDNLPTSVDVSFTIKDLSPALYIPVAEGMNLSEIIGPNSTYQEYLLTLSASTIRDRILFTSRFHRNREIFTQILKVNKLNPAMWGFSEANKGLGRLVSALRPSSRIPSEDTSYQGTRIKNTGKVAK